MALAGHELAQLIARFRIGKKFNRELAFEGFHGFTMP